MLGLGARVAGLSLSAAPRSLRFQGLKEALIQRESFLDCAWILAPRPKAILHVPGDLERAVAFAYESLGLSCRFAPTLRQPMALRFVEEQDKELGTATIRFRGAGLDAAKSLRPSLVRLEAAGARTLYAEVPLSSASARPLIEILRSCGFSFAGVLPGRAEGGTDALVLQRPRDPI